MISRVLEWYRIVNVQPTAETIDRRKAAVNALVKALDDEDPSDGILGAVAGVVAGFDQGHASDAPHVTTIVSSIRAHDSTFPQDLTENALEVRTVAAIALGELMARNPDKPADSTATLVATLIESGTGLRPPANGKYLAIVLTELLRLAQNVLNGAQQHRRRRSTFAAAKKVPTFGEDQADALANVNLLATAVKNTLSEFSKQAMIDREELDVLWWLYASKSTTTNTAFVDLSSGKAALAIGVEVANLCLLPPLANADAFVRKAMKEVKRSDRKKPLAEIMAETDASVWSLLQTPNGIQLGNAFPTLFPITWLCGRLMASNGSAGWPAEFTEKTGLNATVTVQPIELAVQAFRERVAQRQHNPTD